MKKILFISIIIFLTSIIYSVHFKTDDIAIYKDYSHITHSFDSEIVLFTISTCNACKSSKNFLYSNNIPFHEVAIDLDESGKALFNSSFHNDSVPKLTFSNKVVSGYNEQLYSSLFKSYSDK